MAILKYRVPPHVPKLREDEVHVWCFSLDVPNKQVASFRKLLDASEMRRVDEYKFERDKIRFIVSRGILKTLIGGYLVQSSGKIQISFESHGKPKLEGSDLEFNLSHCTEHVLFAFARKTLLGVDIEDRKAIGDVDAMAKQCLAEPQLREFQQLEEGKKMDAFYRIWTRKESLIKATGLGVQQALKDFDVTFLESDEPEVIRAANSSSDVSAFHLQDLLLADNLQASLAMSRPCSVRLVGGL